MKNNYTAVSLGPYAYLSPSVHMRVYAMCIVLLPQLIMLLLTTSWQSLGIIACAVAASCIAVGIDSFFYQKRTFDWIAAVGRGVIIGFLIPSVYPLATVFLIVLCTQLVLIYFLGGFADSWVNPVALTVALCWLLSMQLFPAFSLTFEDLQTKNIALMFIQNGTFPTLSVDARITAFLNKHLFSLFGVSVPEGYVSLLWDSQAIIPAFRFNLLTIVSSIFLIAFNVFDALVPAIYLVVYSLLVRFVGPLFYNGTVGQGDILFALLTSGTLFSAVFLLQWYGTMPITLWGKSMYGIVAGVFAFLIVGCGLSSVGSIFTILVMNVITPLINAIETASDRHYLAKVLAPKVESFKDGTHV